MCVVIDLDLVCLVCLHRSHGMHDIFAPDIDTPDIQIAQKISSLSKMKIDTKNDALPDKICNDCLLDLRAAWRFHKNCQTAAVVFQSILKPKMFSQQLNLKTEGSNNDEEPQSSRRSRLTTKPIADIKAKPIEGIKSKQFNYQTESPTEEQMEDNLEAETSQSGHDQQADDACGDSKEIMVLEMDQSMDGDDDYISMPEGADEGDEDDDDDLVEFYLTDEIFAPELQEESPKKATNTNDMTMHLKIPPRKSLLKNSKENQGHTPSSNKTQMHTPVTRSRSKDNTRGSVSTKKLDEQLKSEAPPTKEEYVPPKKKSNRGRRPDPEKKLPKICELCGNSYRFQHALTAHMRRHFQEKPYQCEMCKKAFVSNVELRRHIRVHTGHKPYACKYCDRRFSDFGSRIKHERTHTGERPYVCGTCGKTFAYPHVLSVHIRTHTGEKKFQCEFCPKGFTKKVYLISHTQQHHADEDGNVKVATKNSKNSKVTKTSKKSKWKESLEEVDDFAELKKLKYDECIYTTEFVDDDEENRHEAAETAECEEGDSQDDEEEALLIHGTLEKDDDDDDGEVYEQEEEEIVEIHLNHKTIRLRK